MIFLLPKNVSHYSLGGFTESYVTFICESLDEHRLVLCCPKGEPLGDFTKSYVAHF